MLDADHTAPSEGAEDVPLLQAPKPRGAQAPRILTVSTVADFRAAQRADGCSQRQFALQTGVKRTTFQGWLAQGKHTSMEPETVAFFESPAGVRFLHRLFQALLLVAGLVGAGGLRHLAMTLRLSGLDRWIASSHGALHAASVRSETCVGEVGDEQRRGLAPKMPPREMALCEDETHHPKPCLVAIEPISNFIIVEQYEARRDAKTWNKAVTSAIADLPVIIAQVTSDLARGIRLHVQGGLEAQHNADVFHVQHDASGAAAAPLAAQERRADKALQLAQAHKTAVEKESKVAMNTARGPGHPVNWLARIDHAEQEVEDAREIADEARQQRESMRRDIREISGSYHPFDLTTGAARSSETVGIELRAAFARMKGLIRNAGLGAKSEALLAKAARVIPLMMATIAWVHCQIASRLAALSLSSAVQAVVFGELIPGLYMMCVARRMKDAYQRETLRERAQALLQKAREGVLKDLPDALRQHVESVALECARLFVAASSCVEGRNGVLRLHLHHLHRIPARKLKALTVVHNYFIRRSDGTTAAERFFGSAHDDLFEVLLARLPPPPRPRPRKVRSDELDASAP